MWLVFFRLAVILILTHSGYVYSPFSQPVFGAVLGFVAALGVISLEIRARVVPGHQLVGALVGSVTGLLGAHLTWGALRGVEIAGEHFFHVLIVVLLIYMGLVVGAQHGEWFEPARIIAAFRDSSRLHQYKILDTSVIIDGRIADICETGFLEGTLVAPQFVLRELQQVADSTDSMKRNRGRRGLDILQNVQKMGNVSVQIVETDFPDIKEVDLKLIELARKMGGKIVTNDFNLNKVAQLRGVPVLNINELANSLKPVVLPGEVMRVFILKEGKEPGQGVGYLDDGTMVVVDQGKKALGKTIEVTVTSVLQTTAGKMIFCRWPEAGPGEDTGRFRALGRDRQRTDRFQAVDRNPTPVPAAAPEPPRDAPPEPPLPEPAPKSD
ncbi:MAG TPA: TRAM domain-containing protein [Vicinamibacteria bacterium]|nr:TRAM domain-containing protein [Vicinamibacteria bacterium]